MPLNPFKLERFFARFEFAVEYLLCSSDCESLSIGDLLALEPEAAGRLQNHWLGYTESQGAPGLRQEIDYATIVRKVTEAGFSGFWGQEFPSDRPDPLPDLEAALMLFNRYAEGR